MSDLIPAWVGQELRPVEKLEAHLKGLRHKAVSVFVIRDGAVLLQRRAMSKYHTPGLWANTCCTHPHWSEASAECATRRLDEELGIRGLAPDYRGRVEYRAEVGGGMIEHELVDVYVASAPRDLALHPDPKEVMETRWMRYDALIRAVHSQPDLYTPWLRIYLSDHAERLLPELISGSDPG